MYTPAIQPIPFPTYAQHPFQNTRSLLSVHVPTNMQCNPHAIPMQPACNALVGKMVVGKDEEKEKRNETRAQQGADGI